MSASTAMTTSSVSLSTRKGRSTAVLAAVVVLVAAVTWAATRSNGREGSESTTNDGGAWLLNRSNGAIGHLNREVLEVTAGIRVADPGGDFDLSQGPDRVLVHDRSEGRAIVIDPRTHQPMGEFLVPQHIQMAASPDGAVVYQTDPLKVWLITNDDLLGLADLDELPPIFVSESSGIVSVPSDAMSGSPIVLNEAGAETTHRIGMNSAALDSSGLDTAVIDTAGLSEPAIDVSSAGQFILLTDGSNLVVATTEGLELVAVPDLIALQQPSADDSAAVGITSESVLVEVDLVSGEVARVGLLDATDPLAPIQHGGCIFAVATTPPTFAKFCSDGTEERATLDGASHELRLRLVNGWVWINDIESGGTWLTDADTPLSRIDDWGSALANQQLDEAEATVEQSGGVEEVRLNPDSATAELVEADQQDDDEENEPPVARDDEARTRVDRPVIVSVLDNDEDTDGDVLLVDSVELTGTSGGQVWTTTTRDGVQLSPPAGFTGQLQFTYTVSDGRGGTATAVGTVTVTTGSQATNQPPEAVTDIATVRAGSSVSLNVLLNDSDPDGDSLALLEVTGDEGTIVADPSGDLTFTASPTGQNAEIELKYLVADDYGAIAEGRVLVDVRLEQSNSTPDARNDSAVTSVGNPARVNVLENDTDADNDSLLVARQPTLVRSPDGQAEALDQNPGSLTTDGEFFFIPEDTGVYLFEYLVSDGQKTDRAQIRVDAGEPSTNLPPTAVRDDVTIPRGGTRLVYALDNDGDPNGDVVGIIEWSGAQGLTIEEVPGHGFRIMAEADAPNRAVFRYAISDGKADPVGTVVVVSVVDVEPVNQPPIARPDSLELRAGRSTTAKVLGNDYDPEGGALLLTRVVDVPGVDASFEIGPLGQDIVVTVGPTVTSSFTFGYDVLDQDGATSAAVVEVRIIQPTEPNRPPIARPDTGRTTQGEPIDLFVLGNDSDPDGDGLQIESVASQPPNGTVELGDDGTLLYTPTSDFTGTDRFSYVLIDTAGERTVGQVQVGVTPTAAGNRPPSANDDVFAVSVGSDPLVLDVLANDFDPDNDPLIVLETTTLPVGTVALDGTGNVVFTPPAELPPADLSLDPSTGEQLPLQLTFVYTLSDGRGNTDDARVRLTVGPEPEPMPPVAIDDAIGPVRGNTTLTVDVVANDEDPDGDPAELTVSSSEQNVRVSRNQLVISVGTESSQHRYLVTDPDGLTSTAIVTVFVVENEAPSVSGLTVETGHETALSLALAPQASDPDGDDLFFVCCDSAVGGIAEIDATAVGILNVRFVPNPGFSGQGGFSYGVDDQAGHLVSGWVVVNVLPPENRGPEASDALLEVEAGSTVPIDLAGLVVDPDFEDALVIALVPESGPDSLTVSLSGSTATVSAPVAAAGTVQSFGYTVTDEQDQSASGTVTVTVVPTTVAAPQATADSARTSQGVAVEIQLVGNDIDPLEDGLQIVQVGSSSDGTAETGGSPGSVSFTPNPTFFGTTTFSYTIRDGANSPERESVGIVTVDVTGRPDAPAPPSANADNATATITWATPVDNGGPIDKYRLGHRPAGETARSLDLSLQNSYTLSPLVNGTEYQFRVQAHNAAGWGDWSDWSAPIRPDTTPDAPGAPTITFSDGELLVDWPNPSNQGSPVVAYKLEIGGGENRVTTLGAVNNHSWGGLANGVEYQFRVAAVNAAGDSDWSGWSASEHPLGAPFAPASPVADRGNQSLDLAWSPPNNNGDPVTGFEIELQSTGQVVAVAGGGTTNYRWSNLTNGVAQQFRVRASNRASQPGAWSSWSAPTVPCSVPDQTQTPTAVRGDQQATVSWLTPDDQGCAILSYNIRANGSSSQSSASTSHVFSGLTNGTNYRFEIQAVNEEGAGPWSTASTSVVPAGPPSQPTVSSAIATARGSISLSWGGADPNGSAIAHHEVMINSGSAVVASGNEWTASGLADNSLYSFQVRACNATGCGAWSGSATATTWGPPSQPRGANASAGDGWWRLNWSSPASNGGSGVTSYEFQASSGGQGTSGTVDASTSQIDLNFPNGTPVVGEVRACNAVGCGPWATATATPTAPPPVAGISIGASYAGAGCAGSCNYIHLTGSNFVPGSTATIACIDSVDGQFLTTTRTVATDGSISADPCFYGIQGRTVWVTVDGTTTNSIVWP